MNEIQNEVTGFSPPVPTPAVAPAPAPEIAPGRIWVVVTVARQVGGEYVLVRTEKAFREEFLAEKHMYELRKQQLGPDGRTAAVRYQTDHGSIDCICEIGAFAVDLQ